MALRVAIGKFGGVYEAKVSKAGYDALTAPIDGMIFDARDYGIRLAAEGTITVETNYGQHDTKTILGSVQSQPHGLGYAPNIVTALGQSGGYRSSAGDPPGEIGNWWCFQTGNVGLPPQPGSQSVKHDNPNLHGVDRWLTPFSFVQEIDGNDHRFGGYRVSWDATNVTVTSFCRSIVICRWRAWSFV